MKMQCHELLLSHKKRSFYRTDNRKLKISSLIARADANSSTSKTLHAKNEEIIQAKFTELIKQIEKENKIFYYQ